MFGDDEGFDPQGDGPAFRDDGPPTQRDKNIADWKAKKDAERSERKKKDQEERERRGLERQQQMNETQFRGPKEMNSLPNPDYVYVPPAPGTYGGPPLPRNNPDEETPKEN